MKGVVLIILVLILSGCLQAVSDTPELLGEYDKCYDQAQGNKTIYDACVNEVLDAKNYT